MNYLNIIVSDLKPAVRPSDNCRCLLGPKTHANRVLVFNVDFL